jgi:hypothetical protein
MFSYTLIIQLLLINYKDNKLMLLNFVLQTLRRFHIYSYYYLEGNVSLAIP